MPRERMPPVFFADPNFTLDAAVCRGCGCHDLDACEDEEAGMACWWVEPDLCSVCAAEFAARLDPAMAGLYAEDAE
ncbi:MAG: hypothetical protein OXG99_12120 [Alphaproteobacteria bacterium]|nr:hypothetical protein [Alphaproteobacteria bacterium]